MPRRRDFYDPFIQAPAPPEEPQPDPEATVLRGISVEVSGVYIHLGDAIEQLRGFAAALEADGKQTGADAVRDIVAAWEQTS